MVYIDTLFQFWIDSSWYVALSMSIGLNVLVFVITASMMDFAIDKLITENQYGNYIDDSQLKHHQKSFERKNGIVACIIFAIARAPYSLINRHQREPKFSQSRQVTTGLAI